MTTIIKREHLYVERTAIDVSQASIQHKPKLVQMM